MSVTYNSDKPAIFPYRIYIISIFGLNIFISYYNYTSIQIYVMIIQAMGLERKLKAYKVLLPNMKYLHKLWRIPVYSRKIGTMSNQI